MAIYVRWLSLFLLALVIVPNVASHFSEEAHFVAHTKMDFNDSSTEGVTIFPEIFENRTSHDLAAGNDSDRGLVITTTLSISQILKDNSKQMVLYKAGMGLWQYIFPTTLFLGLVGNIMSFLVMVQKHNRKMSCCFLMAALACSDIVVIAAALSFWMKTVVLTDGIHDWECKVVTYWKLVS